MLVEDNKVPWIRPPRTINESTVTDHSQTNFAKVTNLPVNRDSRSLRTNMDTTQGLTRRASFSQMAQQLAHGSNAVQDAMAALKEPSVETIERCDQVVSKPGQHLYS